MLCMAEYIWLDGATPTQQLRSKARVICEEPENCEDLSVFPEWGFDGSSTWQATGHDSDLVLQPVRFVTDPIRGEGNYLVLCEVMNADGTPHSSNTRCKLRAALDAGAAAEEPWVGFEQEYTLFEGRNPVGWPEDGYPGPQGPFYCGVGPRVIFGRDFVEAHTAACLAADLMIFGINAEVMPGQWEFQVGYRDNKDEPADALMVCDHLWLARWLLCRIGEDYGWHPSLEPKPVSGDWNGAGCHTNFSTKAMRNPKTGIRAIEDAAQYLEKCHNEHIAVYGHDLEKRLTGHHETCHITEFRMGVADRGASVRIPRHVRTRGCGYLEDRRPGANADPYLVTARLLQTIVLKSDRLSKAA